MRKHFKWLSFSAILIFYSLIYIATTKEKTCDDVCQKFSQAWTEIRANRPYVFYLDRCKYPDLVACLQVKDTIGINWNSLADTACIYLNSVGLNKYKIFVLAYDTTGAFDTVATKQCQ